MNTAVVATPPEDPQVRAAFEAFRAAYPRWLPGETSAAWDAFRQACGRVARPDLLVTAAARYAAQVKRDGVELRFTPSPGRWLRERRFEDIAVVGAAPAMVGAEVRVGTEALALDIPAAEAAHVFRTLAMIIRAAAHGGQGR